MIDAYNDWVFSPVTIISIAITGWHHPSITIQVEDWLQEVTLQCLGLDPNRFGLQPSHFEKSTKNLATWHVFLLEIVVRDAKPDNFDSSDKGDKGRSVVTDADL